MIPQSSTDAPPWALHRLIHRFVQDRLPWIRRQQDRFLRLAREHPPRLLVSGEAFLVWGVPHRLKVVEMAGLRRPDARRLEGGILECRIPPASGRDPRPLVQRGLSQWFRRELAVRLAEQVPEAARGLDVQPRRVNITNARRRWGSCSGRGQVRFNWRLAMLPPALLEYVVVHELAHLKHPDHSPRFWGLVAGVLPDYKDRRAVLRSHAITTDF